MDDPWATLSDEDRYCRPHHQPRRPILTPPAPPWHQHPIPPWGDRKPDPQCDPRCLRCEKAELSCLCDPKRIICDHTEGGNTTDVCITALRVPAVLRIGTAGRELLIVTRCPHCDAAHPHTNHPTAHPYRVAPCGQPYLLETTP